MISIHKKNIFVFPIFLLIVLLSSGCKKSKKTETILETGTMKDIQGNVYNIVKIGNQWWMAENLKVKLYNDSTPIISIDVDDAKGWAQTTSGAFCDIDKRYGLHYNWYAFGGTKKLAPKGWHVPSDEEWKAMEMELGLSAEDVDKTSWRGTKGVEKLFPVASKGWPGDAFSPVYGTNETGFTALPGGCRVFNGTVAEVVGTAYFWTSTQNDPSTVWYRNLSASKTSIFRYFTYKNYGFAIRCVKD